MIRRVVLWLLLIGLAPGTFVERGWASDEEKSEESKKPKTIAVFRLSGSLSERPTADDFPFGGEQSGSLHQMVERMRKAAKDDDVAGVVLLLDDANLGTGQIEEMRRALAEIKQAGKEVYAHVESLSTGKYVLLSGVSRLSAVPTADVMITGIYSESPYLRPLLDKIGVQPDFFTCGEYKSAAEMFMRAAPSPEAKENLTWLLDSIYANYLKLIAEGRGTSEDKVREWIEKGLYTAEGAREAGILDAVEHRQEFVAELKKKFGEDLKFDKKYGQKKPLEVDLSSPFGLLKFYSELLAGSKPARSSKDAVAVVYVEGPIMAGSAAPDPFSFAAGAIAYSTPIRQALDEAARDDKIKAVVLRVNSPGGSAVASEIILNATRRVREKKPLVVSMGDVAGSGGYYVACGTDTIFADSSTLTGSIGVVMGKLATKGLWDNLGVHWEEHRRGPKSGILNSGQPFTDQERAELQAWMDDIYETFKGHVLEARKDKLKKPIDELAGGRVYTGKQALELGLIDRIGGLQEAIAFAAEQANISDYDVRTLPRTASFIEVLLGETQRDSDPGHLDSGAPALPAWAQPTKVLIDQQVGYLGLLEPVRAASMKSALVQLLILDRERVALAMPPLRIRW